LGCPCIITQFQKSQGRVLSQHLGTHLYDNRENLIAFVPQKDYAPFQFERSFNWSIQWNHKSRQTHLCVHYPSQLYIMNDAILCHVFPTLNPKPHLTFIVLVRLFMEMFVKVALNIAKSQPQSTITSYDYSS